MFPSYSNILLASLGIIEFPLFQRLSQNGGGLVVRVCRCCFLSAVLIRSSSESNQLAGVAFLSYKCLGKR